ncbi:MAG: hypothetical protein Tsb002_06580 [Wenzhouxiangellaceae bacterium]
MPNYTLSSNLSLCLESNPKTYFANLFMVFVQSNSHKVVIDSNNIVLRIYERIAENNNLFKTWLDLMSHDYESFEKIKVDTEGIDCEEELFLKVCCRTKGHKYILVESHQSWTRYDYLEGRRMQYMDAIVNVYDKDEAIEILTQSKVNIFAESSIVAANGSYVSGAQNLGGD